MSGISRLHQHAISRPSGGGAGVLSPETLTAQHAASSDAYRFYEGLTRPPRLARLPPLVKCVGPTFSDWRQHKCEECELAVSRGVKLQNTAEVPRPADTAPGPFCAALWRTETSIRPLLPLLVLWSILAEGAAKASALESTGNKEARRCGTCDPGRASTKLHNARNDQSCTCRTEKGEVRQTS